MTDTSQADVTVAAGPSQPTETYLDERRASRAVRLVLTASFVVFADVAIVAIVAPAIRKSLGATVIDIEMMVSTYQIAYAATLITGGRLGDIYGRRTMFIAGIAGFAVTSAACGLATSATELIIFRAFQGVTAALLSPQVLATIQIVLPPTRRSRAYAAQGAVLALATIMGPVLAGMMVSLNLFGLGWRPVFLINLPIGLVAIIMARSLIPTLRSPSAKRLDIPGSLIVFVTLAAVMAALTMGPLYHWPAWAWLCLAVGPLLTWAFLSSQRYQERRGRSPLLPTDLWRDKAFRTGLLLYVVLFSGVVAFYIYYYILLETGYQVAPWWAGITTVSVGIGTIVTSIASVRLVRRWGGRRIVAVGALVSGIGFLSMLIPVTAVPDGAVANWNIPSQILAGAGLGLLLAPLLSVVLVGIRSTEVGAASGLLTTAQMIGGALGVGITGLLFQIPLPSAGQVASAGQLATGMSYSLLYNPVIFGLSLLIIARLPKPSAPAATETGHA